MSPTQSTPPPLPQLPASVPAPPIPGQSPGQKPGMKSQTNLSWLNTSTGKAKGAPDASVGTASGSAPGGKQLTGQ